MSAPGTAAAVGELPATQLRRALDRGELTSAELTQLFLDRIAALDPAVRAVLAVSERALGDAAASDRRRAVRRPRALEGLPVLVKDNIAVAGLPTTAGSRALAGSRPGDARLVRRLRAAGAVILGKTNLSEWGNVRSPRSTSGWSGVGGQTRNPHDLSRTPSGSSSGAAAAIAAGLAPLAVGTESDGSIISPAGTCGIVGLKPTHGVVPLTGVVPVWSEQDVVGPMTRTVADAALLHAVLSRHRVDLDFGARPDALRGLRLGVWCPESATAGPAAILAAAGEALRRAGAVTVDVGVAEERIPAKQDAALLARFRTRLDAYLAAAPGAEVRSLAELVEFNRHDPVELSLFGQENFELALELPDLDPATFELHQAMRRSAARSLLDGLLAEHRLDAVVTLSNGAAPPISYGGGDGPEILTTTPAAVAGYPMVSVPAGFRDALPVGVTFIGSAGSDAALLRLAAAFESAVDARRAPALPSGV